MNGQSEPGNRGLKFAGIGCLAVVVAAAALIIFGIVIPAATSKPDYTDRAIQSCRDEVRGELGDKVEFEQEQATQVGETPPMFEVRGKAIADGTYFTYLCRASRLDNGDMTAFLASLEM